MKKNLLALSFALATTATSTILHAEADIKAGKEKATACAGCHGENGNSMVSTFPKLAQQHSSYLIKQLQSFKGGTRNDPMMSSIALGLKDEDMVEIAAFYSAQKITENAMPVASSEQDDNEDDKPATTAATTDAKDIMHTLLAQGSDLYRNGDLKTRSFSLHRLSRSSWRR